MKKPKKVLFDYEQTLIAEQKQDGVKGTEIALSNSEIDTIFCNAAAPGVPTEGKLK